jgi:hypothetical protein
VLLVALHWGFSIFWRRTRAWTWATSALCAGLMAIYLYGQLPFAIEALRWNLWP